ncbi:ABC transporter permease [Pseudomonas sp. HY13-MNA-CIBAN-0226]|uniref:ABC transporter permease n=1 Tax=Pseudomonas sp. HY13-MNA-CIBAN-0226 TaxID=3140473 RepID=UPI003318BE5E
MHFALNTHLSYRQLLRDALFSLQTHSRRSFLALLGIAIGSASVVAMINLGHNAAENAVAIFKEMGVDMLSVSLARADSTQAVRPDLNVQALRAAVPTLTFIAPISSSGKEVAFDGRRQYASLAAVTPEFAATMRMLMDEGRFFSRFDEAETLVVLGHRLARDLGTADHPVGTGDQVQLDGYLFTVIGIVQRQLVSPIVPVSVDRTFFLSFQGLVRLGQSADISNIIARVAPGQDVARAAEQLTPALQLQFPGQQIQVEVPEQIIEGMKNQTRTFAYLLMALGITSLIGAGVGIMNVMLMNVSQRRREIGVRIALGARRVDIRNLFLLEAMALTAAGALLGVVLGVVGAWVHASVVGWKFYLSPAAVLLGSASTLLVGLFFGLYPALSAARLQPVEALRDE